MTNSNRMNIAKQYSGLMKNVLGDNLISVFLYGSVVRNEDTESSDIDLMAIVRELPTADQLDILGEEGRFNERRGYGEFKEISCAFTTQDRFLNLVELGVPREAVNPLKESVILFDTGFIENIKKQLEDGIISLRKDAYWDYLRYGDIRRSYLLGSIENTNLKTARSDAAAAVAHYLRAYFLYENGEMILSKEALMSRIYETNETIAEVYNSILKGNYNMDNIVDKVDEIRDWVMEVYWRNRNKNR